MSWRRVAAAWGGPLLIAALVVFALRGFAFEGHLSNGHPDILAFWLPRWSFLGRTLADGSIPLWNPYEMTGYRFAADPQSGWLYAPPMLLFSTLGPGLAMRMMIVLQPVLAGLGLYAFLRVEGLARVAATVGGLAIAGAMSESEIAIAMPFAGTLAWGAVTLLGAAGYLGVERWSRRVGWLALTAFAWSQVASAHLSHGLVLVTAVLVAYVIARTTREGWVRSALLIGVLPVLAIGVLLPRFQFLSVSSLAEGYAALDEAATPSDEDAALAEGGVWAGWPLAFAAAPGAYLGAAALIAVPLAFRSRAGARRRLSIAMAAVLAATWILLLPAVLGAGAVRRVLLDLPYGDVLVHNPSRFRYVAVLVLPILAALGVQSLRDDPPPRDRLLAWCAGGAVLWIGLPVAFGADLARWRLIAAMLIPVAVALLAAARSWRWAIVLPALLAVELSLGVLGANRHTGNEILYGLEGATDRPLAFQPLRAPTVDTDAFLRRTALVDAIGDDRYATWAPPAAAYLKGYLFAQDPSDWPALTNERGSLFGIRDTLGYNPVQLPAYWSYIRQANPLPMYYNTSVVARPSPIDLQRLGVRYLVVPSGVRATVPGAVVASADGYDLLEIDYTGSYTSHGKPSLQRLSPTELRVVDADASDHFNVFEAYDPGWRATTDDGRNVRIRAEGAEMYMEYWHGVKEITLTYHDPWVIGGLWAQVAAWLVLGLAWLVVAVLGRPRARGGSD
jgi:hypothetical protein